MSLFFKEYSVIGNSHDTIDVRHLYLKGSNYEIGKKIGELAKDRHHIKKIPAADPLKVRCQLLYLQSHYPMYYERMRGIAEAFEMVVEDDRFDFSLFGDPLIRALGCSAVSYPPSTTVSGHGIISKNEDYLSQSSVKPMFGLNADTHETPALSRPYILEMYPDEGYASISFMSFEMFGESLDGINTEGLAVVHLADCKSPQKCQVEPTLSSAVGLNELKCVLARPSFLPYQRSKPLFLSDYSIASYPMMTVYGSPDRSSALPPRFGRISPGAGQGANPEDSRKSL